MCDNEPVTKNVRIPQSTLSKKHNAVAYHKCREAVAANICRCAHEPSSTNLADLFTKQKSSTERDRLIFKFMYWILLLTNIFLPRSCVIGYSGFLVIKQNKPGRIKSFISKKREIMFLKEIRLRNNVCIIDIIKI